MYIVIEKFNPGWPTIVTDEEGQPKLFDSWKSASEEAEDCQDGIIVDLNLSKHDNQSNAS